MGDGEQANRRRQGEEGDEEAHGPEVDGEEGDEEGCEEDDRPEVGCEEVDGTEVDGTEVGDEEICSEEVDSPEDNGKEVGGEKSGGEKIDAQVACAEVDGAEVDRQEIDSTQVDPQGHEEARPQVQLTSFVGRATPAATAIHPPATERCDHPRRTLVTDDLDRMVDALRQSGARFRGDVAEAGAGRQILVQDPSGNVVELFEYAHH